MDTNTILRSDLFGVTGTQTSVSVIDLAQEFELCICLQNIVEYWAVTTRPREANGYNLSTPEATKRVQVLMEAFEVLPDVPETASVWQSLCEKYKVCGKRAHDARLAATALANGVSHLATINYSDFKAFEEIKILQLSSTR